MANVPPTFRAALLLLTALAPAAPLAAQARSSAASLPPASVGTTPLASWPVARSSFTDLQLRGLPGRSSIWSLLETADAFVIVDRIGGPGLYLGEPEMFGSHGSSWTQSGFRINGLDFTDPERLGTPLMHPDPAVFTSVDVGYSFPTVEAGGAGTTVELVPRPPAATLGGFVEAAYLPRQLQATGDGAVPPIARLASAGQGGALVSGPLAAGFGLLGSVRYAASTRLERGEETKLDSRLGSVFLHGVGSISSSDRIRFVAGGDRARYPFPARVRFPVPGGVRGQDVFGHFQGVWEHAPAGGWLATVSAGYQQGKVTGPSSDGSPVSGAIERLLDGPVHELVVPATGARGRWTASAALEPPSFEFGVGHDLHAGLAISRSHSAPAAQPRALVGERVDGIPARLWDYEAQGGSIRRAAVDLSAWANDSMRLGSRVGLDLGARLEWTDASARGANAGIRWHTVLPRALLRWQVTDGGGLSTLVGYGYSRHRLRLGYLAYGDPAAQAARVYLWSDPNGDGRVEESEAGTLVWTAGPGNRPFFPSRIDPGLRPPLSREFVFGFESRFARHWAFRVTGNERRDYRLVAAVNEGVTLDDYVLRQIPDAGNDFLNPVDDRVLEVYDRRPESFGEDRDILTNPPGHDSHYIGVDVGLERVFDGRWYMLFGAAAHRSDGIGANRNFRVNESDPGLLGETFQNPNALTYARGRLFLERGYVIKWSSGLVTGRGFSAGAMARYQDGQHFSRLVIVPDLAQGPEAVQAYTRGHSRFTFTFTLDTRLEQAFGLAGGRLAVVLDAFNLLNTRNEVEEDPVVTRAFRASTALQPPRTIRLGLRYEF
ncbi:MAG: hypothetical protein EHM24_12505 [Acidobacteria bacterium]|nr:MAG: hypothetical protein EHM24_12505 [Acidobacteriota bacterium]